MGGHLGSDKNQKSKTKIKIQKSKIKIKIGIGPKHPFVPPIQRDDLVPFHFTIKNQKSKIQNQFKNWDRAETSICPTISSLSISPSKIKNQKSKTKIKNKNQNRAEALICPNISSLSISPSKIKN